MLAFIDKIVIPFLNSLYGAVGYLGVMLAMAIESAMVPLPSELILPFAGFLVSDPTQIEPLTNAPWNFWIVVIFATIGNTLGSLIAYAIGAYGGRPFLERYGRYLLIRPHEIELADAFFAKHGAATVFIGRLLPIVRTFISFPAGVARMPLGRFIVYSTAGAFIWSTLLVYAGTVLGANWVDDPARPSSRSTWRSPSCVVLAVVALHLVALGMPGTAGRRPRRGRPRAYARRSSGGSTPPELAVEQQVVQDLQAAGEVERQRRVARARDERSTRSTARSPRRSSARSRSRRPPPSARRDRPPRSRTTGASGRPSG